MPVAEHTVSSWLKAMHGFMTVCSAASVLTNSVLSSKCAHQQCAQQQVLLRITAPCPYLKFRSRQYTSVPFPLAGWRSRPRGTWRPRRAAR